MAESLSRSQLHGRLKNAAAHFLQQRLIVPKIFLEAAWPGKQRVDLLAVDRAGTGDIHVVEVKTDADRLRMLNTVGKLMAVPAHYKYLACFEGPSLRRFLEPDLYSPDGIGRIGVIAIRQREEDRSLESRLILAPERFRFEKRYWKKVDSFLAASAPDLEIRDM